MITEQRRTYNREYGRKRRQDPEYRAQCSEYQRGWRQAHLEYLREKGRRWREANPDYMRRWRAQKKLATS